MSRQRFITGARLRWQGATYQIMRLLPGGQAHLENLLTGVTSVVEIAILVKALFAAELVFIQDAQLASTPEQAEDAVPSRCLADYPPSLVAIARYRLSVIEPLLTVAPRTRAAIVARVQELKATQPADVERALHNVLSVAAIYRWLGDYTRSGHDQRALIPAVRARGGQTRLGCVPRSKPWPPPRSRTSTRLKKKSPLTMCSMNWPCGWPTRMACALRKTSSPYPPAPPWRAGL